MAFPGVLLTTRRAALGLSLPALFLLLLSSSWAQTPRQSNLPFVSSHEAVQPIAESTPQLLEEFCEFCHNDLMKVGGMTLESFDLEHPEQNAELAEKVIRKLRAGMMPPVGQPRPTDNTLEQLAQELEELIDARSPRDPGTRPFQRLNRAEYARLVQDVLGITVDPAEWLPPDQISASFDNIADVQAMSPTLMDAYLNAASEIARRIIGQDDAPFFSKTFSNSAALSQHEWDHIEGTPYGTRGGISALHTFPADGDYVFRLTFMLGWGERFHDIDISVNGERVALLGYGGDIDFQGRKSFPIETSPIFIRAGEHRISAAFIRKMDGPYEDLLRPHDWSLTGSEAGYGTTSPPHIMSLILDGPFHPVGVSDSPARQRIFSCRPTSPAEERPCAAEIITRIATQAYGRGVTGDDVADLMGFYRIGVEQGGFESGIRTALEAILVSPHFLFRMEREPAGIQPGQIYPVGNLDLASRLSFFLWGTNPDEELLELAGAGKLSQPEVLREQARRLLADPRSVSLAARFASLWIRLQDLEKVKPDPFWFPNYSQQLMEAMRNETEAFFDYLVRADRSLLELYNADYSFLNERLARHYGIPGVLGDEFRLVKYPFDQRRGILGHGSVLVQTSLGNRTSPVLRGKWVMEVLMGSPPPPPPPGVPDLEETEDTIDGQVLTTRQRMEEHRKNPRCSSCHQVIDPIGLALDNFDVTGRWRIRENGARLDTRGTYYDGTEIDSPAELALVMLKRPIPLVRQFTESLMAYALGRRIEHTDQPTVRAITADAVDNDYRMSSFLLGVIMSDAFRMKRASEPTADQLTGKARR